MDTKPFTAQQWQTNADFVLPVLLGEHTYNNNNNHYWNATQTGLLSHHFPSGAWRETFIVVSRLILSKKPVHITSVSAETAPQYQQQVATWFSVYNEKSSLEGSVFAENTQRLIDCGERALMIHNLNESVSQLSGGQPIEHVTQETMSRIATVGVDKVQDETAADTAELARQHLDEPPGEKLMTLN